MLTNSVVPEDFRESAFRDYVRIATANAVIASQYVERVLNAICLLLNANGLQFSEADFLSGDSSRTRQTLGKIKHQLKNSDFFDPSFCDRLSNFSQRRNRVVHGLFADTFQARDEMTSTSATARKYVSECEWVAEEAAQLVEVGFGIFSAIGIIVLKTSPDDQKLRNLLRNFEEFTLIGISTFESNLRTALAKAKSINTENYG